MKNLVCALLLACGASAAVAAEFLPFTAASKVAIERSHAGRPFVLAFWSVDCAYCGEELQHLGRLVHRHPAIALVLVCTDQNESPGEISARLDKTLAGARAERWLFSGRSAEHLYFAVDKKWRGELPRAHFYDASGAVRVMSGSVDPQWLDDWANATAYR